MKAVVSNKGEIEIADLPVPDIGPQDVLVKTEYSAISPGTEMMVKENGADKLIRLGYNAAGIIEKVGEGVDHVKVGQRVACYGGPFVKHQEYSAVPRNLVVPVPDHARLEEAALAGLGAIAIHGLRQADLHFGESAVVVGLGIVGQIAAQVANAASCNVIGYDLLQGRCHVLQNAGVNAHHSIGKLEETLEVQTNGNGADSVILCAGGKNADLIDQGLEWVRDRGKVVMVGDIKTEFSRGQMFRKEVEVLISRAAGPGRFDPFYEREGIDYPIGYVRWTEGRNMAEYIRLLAEERIDVSSLISKVFPVDRAAEAYQLYKDNPKETLGVVLKY